MAQLVTQRDRDVVEWVRAGWPAEATRHVPDEHRAMLVTRVPRHRPDEAGEIGWLQGQLAPAVREDVITYPMCDMAMPELTPAFRHDAQLGAVVICTDCTAPSVVEFVNEVISLRPATTSELIAMKRDPAFAAALAQVSAARER